MRTKMTKDEVRQRAKERRAEQARKLKQFPHGGFYDPIVRAGLHLKGGEEQFIVHVVSKEKPEGPMRRVCVEITPEVALEIIRALTARYNHWVREQNKVVDEIGVVEKLREIGKEE
jgi:hypothetical protein